MVTLNETYALNRGIERIDYIDKGTLDRLPDGTPALLPPESGVHEELRAILHKRDLGQFLEKAFSPALSTPSLLSRVGFSRALLSAAAELLAQSQLKGATGDAAKPALRILQREIDLREELATYLGLLLRG